MKALSLSRYEDGVAVFAPGQINAEQARFLLGQRAKLAEELTRAMGRPIRVEMLIAAQPENTAGSGLSQSQPPSLQQAMALPLVRQVLDQFNGTIIEVRGDEPAAGPASTLGQGQPDAVEPDESVSMDDGSDER